MLKNDQTYYKNTAVFTPQVFKVYFAIFQHYSLCIMRLFFIELQFLWCRKMCFIQSTTYLDYVVSLTQYVGSNPHKLPVHKLWERCKAILDHAYRCALRFLQFSWKRLFFFASCPTGTYKRFVNINISACIQLYTTTYNIYTLLLWATHFFSSASLLLNFLMNWA